MKKQQIIFIAMLVGALAASVPAAARRGGGQGKGKMGMKQKGHGMGHGKMRHELMEYLYPVELIRHFATELKLTDDQIKKIRKVSIDVSAEVENLKWDIEHEAKVLLDIVKDGGSKEKVYAQMDNVFKYENKIKKKHVGLMIVLRDILTKNQRNYLDGVKTEWMSRNNRGGPGNQPPPPPPHP
jgi:Spy/CpxP family protein refolding chaperone